MNRILVTGACGQIGSELVGHLSAMAGKRNVISTDIQTAPEIVKSNSQFHYLNVMDVHKLSALVVEHEVDTIFHMAAILSANGEKNPKLAYDVNLQGLVNILEVARLQKIKKVVTPSSIAVFGPDAPKENTPNSTALNPTTMYGVTKAAGEKLLQYYRHKFGLDCRSLRYPGIISSETAPGGGTTDFAVDMYIHAVDGRPYTCFVSENTRLPFMYMDDAIKAILDLAAAPLDNLESQVYNVTALSLTAGDFVRSIQQSLPEFRCDYQPDFRQQIADSWPHNIDDSEARRDWDWQPAYDLDRMSETMIQNLRKAR